MSVAGVGAALFFKVRAHLNLIYRLIRSKDYFKSQGNLFWYCGVNKQNVGGARGKGGNRTSGRQSKEPEWDLNRNRTKVPAKNTPYVRIATPTGYINVELQPGALIL